MGEVVSVSFNSYLQSVRRLYEQGEITLEQYAGCLRRAKERLQS